MVHKWYLTKKGSNKETKNKKDITHKKANKKREKISPNLLVITSNINETKEKKQ